MSFLAKHGLHDLVNERWNAYGQATYISSWKQGFRAKYTNLNGSNHSLSPDAERSFTGTATLFLGLHLWPGSEIYLVPEAVSERPLSELTGLGGTIQNFELQKQGSEAPILYRSRLYFRQTIPIGGAQLHKDSAPMQLGMNTRTRRVVLTIGNFSILDFFDKNSFSGDLRRQFFNMAFLTHAAYDFAADARGYTWGAVAELYFDDWAFRFGRIAPPKLPNQLDVDFRFFKYYGDQVELEHSHQLWKQPGVVRLLGYRNRERMGRFDDAISAQKNDPSKSAANCPGFSYDSTNQTAPDLCWARKSNVKLGIGLNVEQQITSYLGVFARGMFSDGRTEVYSFASNDRSLSLGFLGKGALWARPTDLFGAGYAVGWISKSHADFLNRGGVDGFIGDGKINVATERVFEIFYSLNLLPSFWLTADYQRISNPAYNADRGGVDIYGGRIHSEF